MTLKASAPPLSGANAVPLGPRKQGSKTQAPAPISTITASVTAAGSSSLYSHDFETDSIASDYSDVDQIDVIPESTIPILPRNNNSFNPASDTQLIHNYNTLDAYLCITLIINFALMFGAFQIGAPLIISMILTLTFIALFELNRPSLKTHFHKFRSYISDMYSAPSPRPRRLRRKDPFPLQATAEWVRSSPNIGRHKSNILRHVPAHEIKKTGTPVKYVESRPFIKGILGDSLEADMLIDYGALSLIHI